MLIRVIIVATGKLGIVLVVVERYIYCEEGPQRLGGIAVGFLLVVVGMFVADCGVGVSSLM